MPQNVGTDLVTGGAGFIGSHLVRRLVADGRKVRVVDNFATGTRERLAGLDGFDLIEGDLATMDLSACLVGVDRIFHLAALPSVPRSVRDPVRTHEAVSTATLRLLEAARDAGVARTVLSSSSSVYGDTAVSPKHERLTPRPLSPYAVAKLSTEQYAAVFSRLFGLHTVALRYFNVFGPSQDPASAYAAVMPRFIVRAIAGETLTVFGDGSQTRDFTYVDNVVEANLAAARAPVAPGRVYNIAAGTTHSVTELIRSLESIVGRPLRVEHEPVRAGDILHSHADITAARTELGWAPSVSFEDGLRRTVRWYQS